MRAWLFSFVTINDFESPTSFCCGYNGEGNKKVITGRKAKGRHGICCDVATERGILKLDTFS